MNKIMNRIKTIAVVIIMCVGFYGACWYECHYTRDCVITNVNSIDNSIVVRDSNGECWSFYADNNEFYEVGNIVRVVFFTNHTDTDKYDDEIVSVK